MARTPEQARRRTQVHNQIAVAILIVGCVGAAMWLAGAYVDRWFPDAEGAHTRATLLGRDVAPGDRFSVRVATLGEMKVVIEKITTKLGNAEGSGVKIGSTIEPRESSEDTAVVAMTVPDDAPVDAWLPVVISLDLDTGHGPYSSFVAGDAVTLEVFVRSERGRTARIALDVALACLAWLAAAVLCYAIARWRPLGDRGPVPADSYTARLVASGGFTGIVAIGLVGDLVFVRTLHRITGADSLVLELALSYTWLAGLAVGGALGERAHRAAARWWTARLRPVIGTPPLTDAFRGAGSVLPPSLSRDVDAAPLADILAALAAAGFTHDQRVISRDGVPVARIAAKLATARPEQLALDVFEGYDALPLARALTGIFGPLEISSRYTPATIVDPQ